MKHQSGRSSLTRPRRVAVDNIIMMMVVVVIYMGSFGHFLRSDHMSICWKEDNEGLLPCFSDPSEAVMERVVGSYKQAAACLLGKCCTHCGKLTAEANSLTFQCICQDCYEDDETSYIISKSKAKEAFLLSDKDLKSLAMVAFPDTCSITPSKKITSTFLLANDVKTAAFTKYGGADGLAAAIQNKKIAADVRFQNSQSTSKPQKKRSKIERLSDRPADNIKIDKCVCLPIGTFFDTKNMKMPKSFKCNKCPATGCLADIIMHEKLQHGFITNYHHQFAPLVAGSCAEFVGSTLISDHPAATPGLIQLFSSATFEYARLDFEEVEERKVCIISFNDNDNDNDVVKVCVDFILMSDDMTSLFSAYIDVCFKKGSEHVPLKVLSFDLENGYEYDLSREDEFNHDNFVALTVALGIAGQQQVETTAAAPLMAMFLSRVLDDHRAEEIYEDVVGNSEHHIPLFHDVFKAMIPHVNE